MSGLTVNIGSLKTGILAIIYQGKRTPLLLLSSDLRLLVSYHSLESIDYSNSYSVLFQSSEAPSMGTQRLRAKAYEVLWVQNPKEKKNGGHLEVTWRTHIELIV